jgi:CO/xanthine dehydrogenase Mo-binding subunit
MAETNRTSADDAIANAVYNATGHRIRHLPMTPDRLLNVL